MVGDAAIFMREGGIPAVYHGPGGQRAHADLESVVVADLVRAARVYIRTAIDYIGAEGRGPRLNDAHSPVISRGQWLVDRWRWAQCAPLLPLRSLLVVPLDLCRPPPGCFCALFREWYPRFHAQAA
jgi:hypothetical protein